MPDRQFDHPDIDTPLLPCHDHTTPEVADITTQVAEHFWNAMKMFVWLKRAGQLWSTSIVAHRAFIGCVSYYRDTKKVSCSDVRHPDARPQEFYFHKTPEQKRTIPYTSLEVERDGSIASLTPVYYIKFHHDQNLPVGYFDDETHIYHALGDEEFQRRWTELIQKMLQTGFVSFLQWSSESLTSKHVRTLLSRNLLRLGDEMIADIEWALLRVKQSQTL